MADAGPKGGNPKRGERSTPRSGLLRGCLRGLPWGLLALGALSVVLLLFTDRIRHRTTVEDLELLKSVGELQLDVATSHLWLEEYVTGDDVDILDVYESLDRARSRVRAMLRPADGSGAGPPEGRRAGGLTAPSLEGSRLQPRAAALERHIEEFRVISSRRQEGFEEGLPVGIGSPLDERYDEVFRRLLSEAQDLEKDLQARMERRQQRAAAVLMAVVVGWCFLVTAAAAALWHRERRRRQMESALQESQARLLEAQKLEGVGRLADGLAHDLNNFLAAVRGHCELALMKRGGDEWLGERLQSALHGVDKSAALIEQLREFSRRRPSPAEPVHLNGVVERTAALVTSSLGEQVRLEVHLAEDAGWVEMDQGQLEQVLVNLLLNAREAMDGPGRIRLSTFRGRHEDGGEEAWVAVADDGSGIAPEVRDRLFEPFVSSRAEDGRRGLGLATVDRIVAAAGGVIEVESEPGVGSTFVVRLPSCVPPPGAPVEREEGAERELRGEEGILLVDDNREVLEAQRQLLESLGYQVLCAGGVEEALALMAAAGETVDAIVTDVILPDGSGPELVRRLRETYPMPALFISGAGAEAVDRSAVPQEAGPVLQKPASGRELAKRLRDLLDGVSSGV